MTMAEEVTISFNPLPNKNFSFLQDKHILARLMKWSMLGRISVQSYGFDRCYFSCHKAETFAKCFFRDPAVVCTLRKMEAGLSVPLDKPVLSVSVEPVPCTEVTMGLFDPIYSCGILRPSGHVVKCFHDVHPDYDELRKMLQDDCSEHYHAVGREEREEFLFCLFKHLCLGGELCQYEDTIDPYINTTKQIYKDLISVQKGPAMKRIQIVSKVFKVCAFDESGRCFPGTREEEQTFAYLIVDPFKQQVTLFCHFYGVGNFTL
ncbi:cilia- and flagella-associated protein 300 [Mugil cephalus]|uniref:cilia- and flagella-associated protein 300 n=1 Tax=Mugil cephalus TaxID=48193 RepID=UPI001FB69638|nr:cilia- and flagella-associated protein 300 [Mugil cephalus]